MPEPEAKAAVMERNVPASRNAFRVGPALDGQLSWWVVHQMPNYNPPGARLPTQDEADIMQRMEWDQDTPADAERLFQLFAEVRTNAP